MNRHLYLCHLLVLSSPTLKMHGHTNLKLGAILYEGTHTPARSRSDLFSSVEGSENYYVIAFSMDLRS